MVEQAGSLAGFAAVIGLAVLSALYFSQARDLRRLREWAGRAPERAAETGVAQSPIPGRVVAVPQRSPQAGAGAPPAAAAGEKAATPGASNGDAAPAVAAGKPEDGEAQKADADKADGEAEQKEGEQEKQGEAGAKPGMPAPASAAAAGAAAAASAGAGAASATGPAAPSGSAPASAPSGSAPASAPPGAAPGSGQSGSAAAAPDATGSGPRPTPQRPPGSVLPPRTGTLPPVRRLPSSQAGVSPAQTGVLGQAPQQKKRNPLYIALAVAGVLVVGAAAAIGVPAIVNGTKHDKKARSAKGGTTTATRTHRTSAPAASPSKITVAVLNGTSIPGLAAQIGDRVDADGFTLGTVSNASPAQGQRANSVAMYASGHEGDAKLVAKKLGIHNVQAIDASSQQIAGDATVVVIVGSDKTQ